MDLTSDVFAQYGFFGIAALAAITMVWRHFSDSRRAATEADRAETNTSATSTLFDHYEKEIGSLRERIDELSSRLSTAERELSDTERKLASMEDMYRSSAAGEKRYRMAFAKLLRAHSTLMAIAREQDVAQEKIAESEQLVTSLMMELSKPLDAVDDDPEMAIV